MTTQRRLWEDWGNVPNLVSLAPRILFVPLQRHSLLLLHSLLLTLFLQQPIVNRGGSTNRNTRYSHPLAAAKQTASNRPGSSNTTSTKQKISPRMFLHAFVLFTPLWAFQYNWALGPFKCYVMQYEVGGRQIFLKKELRRCTVQRY